MNNSLPIDQHSYEILEMYKNGSTKREIEDYLELNFSNKSENWRYSRHVHAVRLYELEFKLKQNALINIHLKRYEKIYNNNKDVSLLDFPNVQSRAMAEYLVAERLSIAMTALQSKEKILGLHGKNAKIQINNFFNNVEETKINYNLSKLTLEEQIRVKEIFSKMIIKETVNISIDQDVYESLVNNQKTIDIKHTEIPDVANNLIEVLDNQSSSITDNNSQTLESLKDKINQSNSDFLDDKLGKKKSFKEKINELMKKEKK